MTNESVVFHEYPKLLYIWPVIVLGFAFYFFAEPRRVPDPDADLVIEKVVAKPAPAPPAGVEENGPGPLFPQGEPPAVELEAKPEPMKAIQPTAPVAGEHETLGWVYLITIFLVILTLSVDVERNFAAFWAVALIALWLATWLLHEKGIPVFTHVYRFFADLDVSYERGYALALSIFLLFPFLGMLLWSRLNHRWRITHNEFEHYAWGRADDSLARGAKRVRTTYPDLLEFILGMGAGTLHVYSASGQTELRRIPNVPMLFVLRKRINRILETTQVTGVTEIQQSIIADESASAEPEPGGGQGNEKL